MKKQFKILNAKTEKSIKYFTLSKHQSTQRESDKYLATIKMSQKGLDKHYDYLNAFKNIWSNISISVINGMGIKSENEGSNPIDKVTYGATWLFISIKYILQNFLSFMTHGHSSYLNFEISCKKEKGKKKKNSYKA